VKFRVSVSNLPREFVLQVSLGMKNRSPSSEGSHDVREVDHYRLYNGECNGAAVSGVQSLGVHPVRGP
jgi:hypothetical protein